MSAYRSYMPWKSNFSSYSSKYSTGGSRFTTSRDDVSGDSKAPSSTTARFGSIASPSTYRPSYSGGTYRSVPIKKEPPVEPSYSRFSNISNNKQQEKEKEKTKDTPVLNKTTAQNSIKYNSSKDLTATPRYISSSTKDLTTPSQKTSRYASSIPSKDLHNAENKSSLRYPSTNNLSSASSESKPSRYGSNTTLQKPKKDEGPPVTYNTRYGSKTTAKDRSRDPSPSISSSLSSLSVKSKRDDGPPVTYNSRFTKAGIRDRSRDPSPSVASLHMISSKSKKDEGPPITYNTRYSRPSDRARSRDPSPAVSSSGTDLKRPTITISNIRSRDPSPIDRNSNLLRRSRDPSPAEQSKDRFGTSAFNSRLYSRSSSTGPYSSKYGAISNASSVSRTPASDKALSYMTHNEAKASSVSRQSSASSQLGNSKQDKEEKSPLKELTISKVITSAAPDDDNSSETSEETVEIEEVEVEDGEEVDEEEIIMVQLSVITRGTSPNPPSSSSFLRTRRADMAKTVEKTVLRPLRKPKMEDKEIQSDRLDDPTRYSRFSGSSRVSSVPWSSYLDTKYSPSSGYSRYSSISPSKYSRDSSAKDESESALVSNEKDSKDEKLKNKETSPVKSVPLSRSTSSKNLSKSSIKSEKGKSLSSDGSKKSPSKQIVQKQKSSENSSKALPPPSPKSESPVKSSSASGCLKWTNKDFRKSALNMGPADRPRKSRSSTPPMEKSESSPKLSNSTGPTRSERSPSVGSESSHSTLSSSSEEESKQHNNKVTKASSRTSLLASSADELPMDKPTTKSSTPPNDSGAKNEEAKSFLIRALGPVANYFKTARPSPQSSEKAPWLDSGATSVSESIQLDTEPVIKEDVSGHNGEIDNPSTWWANPDDQLHTEVTLDLRSDMKFKLRHIDSGERAWWLNSNENTPELSKSENKDSKSVNDVSVTRNESVKTDSLKQFKIKHVESGERAWWLTNENSPESDKNKKNIVNNVQSNDNSWRISSDETSPKSNKSTEQKKFKIRHIESGERAWWLESETQSPVKQKTPATAEEDEVSESEEIRNVEKYSQQIYGTEEPPLGDRASPEGLEDRRSPYDNIPSTNISKQQRKPQEQHPKILFISRHTNIDEILGGTCHPLSPIMDRFMSKDVYEEITPAQVRIHDSTAQMPVIQRATDWDTWDHPTSSEHQPQMLDDAALQVYKDGDYGAYLDLESSLAEQSEEIEGLQSSRKNSLVVRTQLSVRVHAIIEKLLSSEGRDLRRALFSLKQIFQEDKDLVHGFVGLGGLNCLVRVGSGADQNYQNYILRALGQVMLYVDGMNGVMKNGPTVQWLYSLIASKYRLVVKTALKLLLVFVEYVESNCFLLVNAIHAVDTARGTLPWTNIMRLLKDYENADTELLIYATSLINKTLSGLSDQDSFYDESDYLEQQGMEGVIQRYMSRPGTDLDLLDQLQLYEAVLKFEDGETDGIRIPDNSVRKTLRYRANGTDSTERRKSRRHSTGTTPSTPPPIPPPPIPQSPNGYLLASQQTLDEDSSSSQNSNELNGVFRECREKGTRGEGAGVTPGLRRRRERAERQKSFIREQQEAAAAGIRYNNNEENGHGHIVTAVPIRLQNGKDNHLPSLVINNNNNNSSNKSYQVNGNLNGYKSTNGTSSRKSYEDLRLSNHHNQQNGISVENNNNNNNSNINNNNSTEYVNNKTIIMKQSLNINHLNGYGKLSGKGCDTKSNNNHTTDLNGYSNHKQFETESNRLNQYYSKLTSVKNGYNNSSSSALNNSMQSFNQTNSEIILNHHNGGSVSYTNGHHQSNGGHSTITPTATSPTIISNGNSYSNIGNCAKPMQILSSDKSQESDTNDDKKLLLQLKRDHTVKDLTQKLSNLPMSPQEDKPQNRIGDMSGLISKAKEGLAKSKSKGDISRSPSVDQELKKSPEPKKSENELHWEELVRNINRPLNLCDLDFTDLGSEDEKDVLAPRGLGGMVPPPPPPIGMPGMPGMPGIPPPIGGFPGIPPPINMMPPPTNLVPPPGFNYNLNGNAKTNGDTNSIKKNKKTVKLFWKEVREDMIPTIIGRTIWDELPEANVDTQKLEHLFESRAKDLMAKKQQEMNKNKEIIVLDHKRSNAINIAMTKLPPPRAIKAAILKMDATVVTREGIDKLLNMLPTEEERCKIQEAQMVNPELPLGSAEQFLLTLSSISELAARLKLWAFKLDFENSEKEIAEPLMDLKQGLESLKANKTFKCILSTLLSIGIFLNGAPVKGFQVEYLAKVPEVKDTVHKHSLLHHLCYMVMETSPDTTDLYSEIGPITRASKADFADLAHNIVHLETECKASWDRLKLIAKHDCPPQLKQKLVDFLADCAERIIILDIVHRRVINRYRKFLLWLGVPQHRVAESRPNEFCRIISEFALEYRTTRERVQQQIEKKANHRERNKTRGKMIIDVGKFKSQEDRADAELRQLLGSPLTTTDSPEQGNNPFTWRRRRPDNLRSPGIINRDEQFTDGDDEILESLVKTATKAPGTRTTPRERKRTRHADRKSLRRTLKGGLTEEEKQHVATFIKGV